MASATLLLIRKIVLGKSAPLTRFIGKITVGFTIFPYIVALVHKKPYVDHYLSCRRFGDEPPRPRRPLTRLRTFSSVSLFSKRTAHHDGQRLWPIALPVALAPPICFMPRDLHTVGDAPQRWFRRNRRWGRELPTLPPTPFRRFYALRQPSADMAGRNRMWRCHPQFDHCRVIPKLWAMPPTFGFVGIDCGGE